MYVVRDSLPVGQLAPGSYLLSGPAMSGKRELMLDIVIEGLSRHEGGLAVTTNQGATGVIDSLTTKLGHAPENLGIVDCVSEQRDAARSLPAGRVEHVSSPGDLTGIGIAVSEQLRRFSQTDIRQIRVGFYSLSALLMYADLETVFRFVHVLCGRIDSIDGLGLFAIDPTTHEESTVNTLKQLFEGMVELRETDTHREVRLLGVSDASPTWVPYS